MSNTPKHHKSFNPVRLTADEIDAFVERYEAKKAEADALCGYEGKPPTLDNRLPKVNCLSYQHPAYNPKGAGKVCIVCDKQKSTSGFNRSKYHQDSHTEICRACTVKYEDFMAQNETSQARKRRIDKQVKKEARDIARKIRNTARFLTPEHKAKVAGNEAALRELAQRKLAKDHLLPFIQRFNDKYEAGWVHRAICKRLERFSRDVAARRSPRLMIFMPPRAGKSEIASKTFPAWHLGHHPDHEIIAASYAVSLPMGFSRKIKDIVATPSYRRVFPETKLNPNAQAAEAWLTTEGGGYVAAGVGSGITGKGAHCLPGNTPVSTELGLIDIEHLYRLNYLPRVHSYNPGTGKTELRSIQAVHMRSADNLYEIETFGGAKLTLTGEHPVFNPVNERYIRADRLKEGDRIGTTTYANIPGLRVLSDSVHEGPVQPQQIAEARMHGVLLLQGMQPETPRDEECEEMRGMRSPGYIEGEKKSECEVLLRRVRRFCATEASGEDLSAVRDAVSPEEYTKPVLLAQVCGSSALAADGWGSEPPLQGRDELCEVVSEHASPGFGAGQRSVRVVPDVDWGGRTPRGWGSKKQPPRKLGGSVQNAPHDAPQVSRDTVSSVKRVGRGAIPVYDLQVEGTHNFLAGEIWVHNCAIIDDPVKDAEEADSEAQREKVWDWYSSTFYTRLAPGGGVLAIMTRWHDADLCGMLIRQQKELEIELTEKIEQIREELGEAQSSQLRLQLEEELARTEREFEDREQWDILVFPQVATHDEYYNPQNDTFAVEYDIGHARIRKKGEVLHPQRFNERMITRMRQTMQPRHWSALHQQNPVPDEGDIFTKSMFRYEPTVPDWRQWDIYIAGDLALGKKQHNDWSVLVVGAMDYEGQLHIIEMSRFKGGADPITENLLALLRRYEKQLVRFGLEEGQIQMAIWPEIERKIIQEKLHVTVASGKHALKPVSDKLARSRVAQAMMQQGRIIWPENQPWVEDARSELLRFPGGIHDDVVDAVAWLARLTVKAPAPQPRRRKKHRSWKDKVNEVYRSQIGSGGGGYMGA